LGETAQQNHIGRVVAGQNLTCPGDKFIGNISGAAGVGTKGIDHSGRYPGLLGVGIADGGYQTVVPEDNDEAVFPDRSDKEDGIVYGGFVQQPAQLGTLLGSDASGSAVGNQTGFIDGAEVSPGGNIPVAEVEVYPDCLQCSPPDVITDGVVAEQCQVTRRTTRRYPGTDQVN